MSLYVSAVRLVFGVPTVLPSWVQSLRATRIPVLAKVPFPSDPSALVGFEEQVPMAYFWPRVRGDETTSSILV